MNMKKKGKMLSDEEKEAKMSVIKAMRDEAQDQMGGKLASMKKVTVASPDAQGLKEGLDKAKELIDAKNQMHGVDDENEEAEEAQESPESMDEYEGMSEEELNMKLQKLMALKQKMEQQKAE